MPNFSTTVRTDHASKYLQQLCKHFAHKVRVEYSPAEGRVAFPPGLCLMNADDEGLSFYCKASEERAIPVIQSIIDNHLVKFAWREELSYEWEAGMPEEIASLLADDDFLPPADDGDGNGGGSDAGNDR